MTQPQRAPGSHWGLLAPVAVVVIVVDQVTKVWAVAALADGPIQLVGSLQLNLVRNYASAFSIGGGSGWGPLVSVIAVGVVVALLWMARSGTSKLGAVSIGLVAGGAFGNLIDRAVRSDRGFLGGGVVDFVDVGWWPVFNVADAAIVVGVVTLVGVSLFGSGNHTGDPAAVKGSAAETRSDGHA